MRLQFWLSRKTAARRVVAATGLLLAGFGCRSVDTNIVGQYPGPLALQDWRTIARTNQPERGEILRVVDAGRSETLSNHIAIIRSRELPHIHHRHDLTVVILDGQGTMVIGKEERKVGRGAVLFIPRGTVHHFSNESDEPSVGLAVFAPPFDGQDREVVGPRDIEPGLRPGEPWPGKGPPARMPGEPQSSPGDAWVESPEP